MQPRIYTYKITFEEVPYYYYGSKKEKCFDEEYFGSPETHKWCWELYTPKKQILELFDYTDEGYKECREIENRLIRPVLNDPWCLNEHCGGNYSLEIARKSGLKTYELGKGIHARSKEEMQEHGRKSGLKCYELGIGYHGRTKEQMIEDGKKAGQRSKELGVGIFALTPEQRSENSKRIGAKAKENKTGICALTKEQLSEIAKKVNSQKWQCTETGFISTSGPLTLYQNKRGIDKSKRVKV